MSLQLNGTAGVTYNDGSNQPAAASPYGLKNLIINGDMRIAQRGTSATITGGSVCHTVDRFIMNIDTTIFNSIATMGQNLDSLTPPSDFSNYVGIQINTGTALSGNPYYNFRQQIEGNNLSHLKFGTSDAKTITLSFWVRSTLTGDFSFSLRNGASNRSYVTTYNIASANTWEKKTITITGDTTGTWAVDNTIGLTVNWGLGNSSGNFSTSTLNEWQAGSLTGATTGVDLVATTNAKWYITGVQLEIGDTATPFENRMYSQELAMCQRYYYKIAGLNGQGLGCVGYVYNSQVGVMTTTFPVQMRIRPTALETTGTASDYSIRYLATATVSNTVPSFYTASLQAADVQFFVPTTTLTAGQGCMSRAASNSAYLAWSAEL